MRIVTTVCATGFMVLGALSANAAGEWDAAKAACSKAIASAAGVDVASLASVEVVPKDGQWHEVKAQSTGQSWVCKANVDGTVKEDSVVQAAK